MVSRCAYGVIVIGIFWVSEALPLAVTSLLPVVLFPLLGVMTAKDVCKSYFKDTLMLFVGSLIVAVAVERCDLHRRIALRALTLVGPDPRWLMLGIMLPSWFLSMWMSNTATTAMMVPILSAILGQIKACREADAAAALVDTEDPDRPGNDKAKAIEMEDLVKENGSDPSSKGKPKNALEGESDDFIKLAKTFALCTAYAANAGGMATLTGTPPNIVFKGIADKLFEDYNEDSGITFANWLIIGFPLSLITFVFIWLWMQVYYSGKKCCPCVKQEKGQYDSVKRYLRKEYDSLGKMTFAETVVLIDFILLVVLWITRKPEFVPGWGNLFEKGYVTDSIAAILMGVVLFVLPFYPPGFLNRNKDSTMLEDETEREEPKGYVPILNWEIVNAKLAWGVIILMGGGFALADACEHAGLSGWVGENLKAMGSLPPWVIALILAYIVAAITNITSNSATATLFLPIAGKLAINLEIHPLYFMIPVTIAASFAFLLPVGTPPNAIVFSTGYLKVSDMVIAGAVVNVVSVLFLIVAMNLWIVPFYGLLSFPPGFRTAIANTTSSVINGSTPVPTPNVVFYNVSSP